MKRPEISVEIASAITENGGMAPFGDGRTKWYMPNDLNRFRRLTTSSRTTMAIAATTFSVMRAHSYPLFADRHNVVVGQAETGVPRDHTVARDFEDVLKVAAENQSQRIFLVGDSAFYQASFSLVKRLHLTVVQGDHKTHEQFPDFADDFGITYEGPLEAEDNGTSYIFKQYSRLKSI